MILYAAYQRGWSAGAGMARQNASFRAADPQEYDRGFVDGQDALRAAMFEKAIRLGIIIPKPAEQPPAAVAKTDAPKTSELP